MKKIAISPVRDVERDRRLLGFGARAGEARTLGFIAHRCTAIQAEALKRIRDSGEYKKYGYVWKRFCEEVLGISQPYADGMIRNLEEHGPNFFLMAELIQISPQTYKLIAGSVSDDGIEIDGEKVPIKRENRAKIAAAVKARRKQAQAAAASLEIPVARQKLNDLMAELLSLEQRPSARLALIGVVREAGERIATLDERLCQTTELVLS